MMRSESNSLGAVESYRQAEARRARQQPSEGVATAEAEPEASRLHDSELDDRAPVGYLTLSEEGLILQANLTAATLLGEDRAELLEQPILRFILNEEHDIFRRYNLQILATGERHTCDLRMAKKDGTVVWVHLASVRVRDSDGRGLCRMTLSDVTESRRAKEALREQQEFYHQIAENLSDFIAVLDLEGRRIYNRPSYRQFFGATRDLRNTDSFAEVHPDDRERIRQVFRETVQTGEGQRIEFRFLLADGSVREMESRSSVIRDRHGQVARVLVVSHDVTERKQLQEQVRKMAFYDDLTGLPNRRLFSDRLSQAMAAGARNACYGALMFLDLDNFKQLNDTYGHDIGDKLLIEAADRLKHCVREIDTVARFGGDEFVVMLSQLDLDKAESIAHAAAIAERLRVALSAPYPLPVSHGANAETGVEHRCTASIGVALFGVEANSSFALRRADAAMYQAKQGGGDQVRFCNDDRKVAAEG